MVARGGGVSLYGLGGAGCGGPHVPGVRIAAISWFQVVQANRPNSQEWAVLARMVARGEAHRRVLGGPAGPRHGLPPGDSGNGGRRPDPGFVVGGLAAQPERGIGPARRFHPPGQVRGDRGAAGQHVVQGVQRDAEQRRGGSGVQLVAEAAVEDAFAGMGGNEQGGPRLMVIHEPHVVGVAVLEAEDQALQAADPDRVEPGAVAGKGMQAVARQGDVAERAARSMRLSANVRIGMRAQEGFPGRPESVTVTRPGERSTTAVTVAIHEEPERSVTAMRAPGRLSGRRSAAGPDRADPQPLWRRQGRQPGSGAGAAGGGSAGAGSAFAGKSCWRASSRTWRAQADTFRWRCWRRAARRSKAWRGRRTWRAGLRGTLPWYR